MDRVRKRESLRERVKNSERSSASSTFTLPAFMAGKVYNEKYGKKPRKAQINLVGRGKFYFTIY